MSVMQTRGGVPHLIKASVDTTGRFFRFPFTSAYVLIRVTGQDLRIFFSEDDFNEALGTNYFTVGQESTTNPHGEFAAPMEARGLWMKGAADSAVMEMLVFQRRG
jgi:hypothetical protein